MEQIKNKKTKTKTHTNTRKKMKKERKRKRRRKERKRRKKNSTVQSSPSVEDQITSLLNKSCAQYVSKKILKRLN